MSMPEPIHDAQLPSSEAQAQPTERILVEIDDWRLNKDGDAEEIITDHLKNRMEDHKPRRFIRILRKAHCPGDFGMSRYWAFDVECALEIVHWQAPNHSSGIQISPTVASLCGVQFDRATAASRDSLVTCRACQIILEAQRQERRQREEEYNRRLAEEARVNAERRRRKQEETQAVLRHYAEAQGIAIPSISDELISIMYLPPNLVSGTINTDMADAMRLAWHTSNTITPPRQRLRFVVEATDAEIHIAGSAGFRGMLSRKIPPRYRFFRLVTSERDAQRHVMIYECEVDSETNQPAPMPEEPHQPKGRQIVVMEPEAKESEKCST